MIVRTRGSRRWAAAAAVLGLVASTLLVAAAPAAAAPGPVHGAFTLAGTGGQYTGTMTMPAAFPAATFTSNSRADAGIPSGASAFLTAATPFGQVYGSSRNKGYLNQRPAADNASSPSTTTYTFAYPTPAAGWGFVLSDIDAAQVQVQATGPGGLPVAVADLGFAGVFNFCDIPSPRPSACSGVNAPFDLPTWDPATGILSGNTAALDTTGASGWFQPKVPLRTLTFVFTGHSGFPVYSTGFATLTRAVSGIVTIGGTAGRAGVRLGILGPGGVVVGTVSTGADGTYSLDGLAPGEYTVRAATPAGYQPVGPSERDADLVASNATGVDFDLTLIKYPAIGTVTADGTPVSGATVSCLGPTGTPIGSAVTDSSGAYSCPPVPPGTGYSVVPSLPEGYAADGPLTQTFDVVDAAVTGLDFALTAPPPITTETSSTPTTATTATTATTSGTTAADTTTSGTTTPDTTSAGIAPDTTTTDTTSTDTTSTDTTTTDTTSDSTPTVILAVTWSILSETSDEFVDEQIIVDDQTYDEIYDTAYDSEQSDESALATTGSPIESMLRVGAALVLGGGLLMLFGRRRRGAHR